MNEALSITLLTLGPCCLSTLLSSIIAIPLEILLGIHGGKTSKSLKPIFAAFTGLPLVIARVTVYPIFPNHGILGSLEWLYASKVAVITQMLIVTPITCFQISLAIMPIWDTYPLNSLSLGLSPFKILKQVPKGIRVSIIAAAISDFGRVLAEVGAVAIAGGDVRFKTRVMTSAIILENNKGNYQMVFQLGFILVIISLIASFSAAKFSKVAENDRT